MDRRKLLLDITAYADNEISSGEEKARLSLMIENDPFLKREYFVQQRMKRLVSGRAKQVPTPEGLRNRIRRQTINKKSFSLWDFLIYQPAYSVSVVIIGMLLLIGFSIDGNKTVFRTNESGDKNIFLQAGANFGKILEGKLTPQLVTSDHERIKEFFANSGVKYNTILPDLASWKMLGCVVSDESGNKLAHHVYTNENGKLLYVYQADKKYFSGKKVLSMSQTLMRRISLGKPYFESRPEYNIMVAKIGDNIFTFVSNETAEKVKDCLNNYLTKVKS